MNTMNERARRVVGVAGAIAGLSVAVLAGFAHAQRRSAAPAPARGATFVDERGVRASCSVPSQGVEWNKLDRTAMSIYQSFLRRGTPGAYRHPALEDGRSTIMLTASYTGAPAGLAICGCRVRSVERPGVANVLVPLRALPVLSRRPFVQHLVYGDAMEPSGTK